MSVGKIYEFSPYDQNNPDLKKRKKLYLKDCDLSSFFYLENDYMGDNQHEAVELRDLGNYDTYEVVSPTAMKRRKNKKSIQFTRGI